MAKIIQNELFFWLKHTYLGESVKLITFYAFQEEGVKGMFTVLFIFTQIYQLQ